MDYSFVLVIFHSFSHPFSAFLHSSLSLYRLQVWDLAPLASLSFIQFVAPGGDQEARRERSQGFSSCLLALRQWLHACPYLQALPPPPFLVVPPPLFLPLLSSIRLFPCLVPLSLGMLFFGLNNVYSLNLGYPSVSSPFTKVSSFEPSWKKSLSFWDSDRHTLLNIFLTRYCQIALQKGYIQLYFHL